MPIIVDDNILVSWRGLCFGQRIILTQWYRVTQAPAEATPVTVALAGLIDDLDTGGGHDVTTSYLACLPEQYRLTQIRAQRISIPRSAYVPKTKDLPGTNEADATVANDSAALTMRTARAGRSQVATKHIGPIPDSVSANGLLGNGYKALLVTLGNKLSAAGTFGAEGVAVPCIKHANGSYDEITTFVVGDQSRVMRRRTVGVGE